jgi:predicted nucleic acid-binding protein
MSRDTGRLKVTAIPLIPGRKSAIAGNTDGSEKILKIAKETVELTPDVEALARRLEVSGLKPLDALHLAFASASKVDYFITNDDKLLKKARRLDELNIKVVSPTELVMEVEI